MKCTVTTTFLEMLDPSDLRVRTCPDSEFRIMECVPKQAQYNRFLYGLVGQDWHWTDKNILTDEQWRTYAEADNLRTWVGYVVGSPAGYYELHRHRGDVEIVYFGLAKPFIGKGLGGPLLSHAIQSAWDWDAKRVWVHTCTLDHPRAIANYQARGMKIYKTETTTKDIDSLA
jgi:GNAT superfamily N-acetyltransferase